MKILESEFRNELYKSLTDAGYTKPEAQKIVGVKYYEALKIDTKEKITKLMESVDSDSLNSDDVTASMRDIHGGFNELIKLKDIIS